MTSEAKPVTTAMMRALVCDQHGPPELLQVREVTRPLPGPGEIQLRVHAAGLNFPDALIIQNKYQVKPDLPFTPGGEVAGIVTALGDGVDRFRVGDRVAALIKWGGLADYAVAQVDRTTLVPDGMDLEAASALTFAHGTSHHALKQRGEVKPGETVLVLGAAGGVGLAAVQIAKAMGAKVIAAASSAEKLALARENGADELVNYSTEDIKAAVNALTGGRGVDVIYDPVGDKLANPAFRTIAWGGRYLVIGFAGGEIPALPLNLPLLKGASIVGVLWGAFVTRDPQAHQRNMVELYAWWSQGKVKPHISARFDLTRASEAIRSMMERKVVGKVVVTTGAG